MCVCVSVSALKTVYCARTKIRPLKTRSRAQRLKNRYFPRARKFPIVFSIHVKLTPRVQSVTDDGVWRNTQPASSPLHPHRVDRTGGRRVAFPFSPSNNPSLHLTAAARTSETLLSTSRDAGKRKIFTFRFESRARSPSLRSHFLSPSFARSHSLFHALFLSLHLALFSLSFSRRTSLSLI